MGLDNEKEQISDEKRVKNFEAFKSFLKTDMKIKEELFRIAPSKEDDYNEEARIEYTDKLARSLKDFEDSLKIITEGFEFGDEVLNSINVFFRNSKENLAIGKYENGVGVDAYQKSFSSMRPEFVDEVKRRCVGYTCASPARLADLINKSTSVNEVLHVMHSYIMNNEEIMKSMPKLGEKKNDIGEKITLYGEPSQVSNDIFENFPLDLDVGITDIISMKNNVFMMVRDRGHALTIDMDTSKEGEVGLKYFVPKLCNEDMIKSLKGIDKSSISERGARGSFSVKQEEITQELFGFIEKVPTDFDIPRPNWDEIFADLDSASELPGREEVQNTKEPLIDTVEPIFSQQDARTMMTKKERKTSGMKALISKIFNKLSNKSPQKESQNKDENEL